MTSAPIAASPGHSHPDRKLIRTGRADIEVADVEEAILRIRRMAGAHGGSVDDESAHVGATLRRTATIALRVPTEQFEKVLESLRTFGKVERLTVNTHDATEQFIDIDARIANSKRLEQRLLAVLESHAGSLGDLLQAERELARVRSEIEAYEGRLRLLNHQAEMNALVIHVYERAPLVSENPGESIMREAFRIAWRNLVITTARGIALVGALLPILVLFAIPSIVLYRRRRRQL